MMCFFLSITKSPLIRNHGNFNQIKKKHIPLTTLHSQNCQFLALQSEVWLPHTETSPMDTWTRTVQWCKWGSQPLRDAQGNRHKTWGKWAKYKYTGKGISKAKNKSRVLNLHRNRWQRWERQTQGAALNQTKSCFGPLMAHLAFCTWEWCTHTHMRTHSLTCTCCQWRLFLVHWLSSTTTPHQRFPQFPCSLLILCLSPCLATCQAFCCGLGTSKKKWPHGGWCLTTLPCELYLYLMYSISCLLCHCLLFVGVSMFVSEAYKWQHCFGLMWPHPWAWVE